MIIKGFDNDGNYVEFKGASISPEWKIKRWTVWAGIFVIANAVFWIIVSL